MHGQNVQNLNFAPVKQYSKIQWQLLFWTNFKLNWLISPWFYFNSHSLQACCRRPYRTESYFKRTNLQISEETSATKINSKEKKKKISLSQNSSLNNLHWYISITVSISYRTRCRNISRWAKVQTYFDYKRVSGHCFGCSRM